MSTGIFFSRTVTTDDLPQSSVLQVTIIHFGSHNNGILKCFDMTTLQETYYCVKKLSTFTFIVVKTKNEIFLNHPTSNKLFALIKP